MQIISPGDDMGCIREEHTGGGVAEALLLNKVSFRDLQSNKR